MKKNIFYVIVIALLLPKVAIADVYYVPSSTQTMYIAPDPYYQMGAALGNIFAQASAERQLNKMKKKLQQYAKECVQMLVQGVDNLTTQQLSEYFRQMAFQTGGSYQVNENGNIWQGVWQKTYQDATRYEEWTVDYSLMQARVLVRILPIGIEVYELAPLK